MRKFREFIDELLQRRRHNLPYVPIRKKEGPGCIGRVKIEKVTGPAGKHNPAKGFGLGALESTPSHIYTGDLRLGRPTCSLGGPASVARPDRGQFCWLGWY